MIAIFFKEIKTFFNGIVGYLMLTTFTILTGLFLWVFQGSLNIFDTGFADLIPFFKIIPLVFIVLIPALCMATFSSEKANGTLELMLIKPIGKLQIVFGKFLGVLMLITLALLPTLVYVLAISSLGNPPGNYDLGLVLGGYLGIFLLSIAFSALGLFASSVTNNQIVALIIGVLLCFALYYGPFLVSELLNRGAWVLWIEKMGAKSQYDHIAKGVITTANLGYFIVITLFFLWLTKVSLVHYPSKKKNFKIIFFAISISVVVIYLSSVFYTQVDFTEDQRFTLSALSKSKVKDLNGAVTIDILLEGDLPPEFMRLKEETLLLLDNFKKHNTQIKVNLVNPQDEAAENPNLLAELQSMGLKPASVTITENGKTSQEFVIPWALVNFGDKTQKVSLLKNQIGATLEDRVNNSIRNLEFVFADAFAKLGVKKKKQIAILKGNGELEDLYLADFLREIRDYYRIAPFTLKDSETNPQKVLEDLKQYDLVVVAGPSIPFTPNQKLIIDQYITHKGKMIWLVEGTAITLDSLQIGEGKAVAVRNELNLDDFFFNLGVRINYDLVEDLYNTPMVVATGQGRDTQYSPLPCSVYPMVFSSENHPINNNIGPVKLEFVSSLDTLPNTMTKTVLLQSSPYNKSIGLPAEISFESITQIKSPKDYEATTEKIFGLYIEGSYQSMFKNRIKPFESASYATQHLDSSKIFIFSDASLIRNQTKNGQPIELGLDKWTNAFYDNKTLLINGLNYALGDDSLIALRTKKVLVPLLDLEKVATDKTYWQIIVIGLPLLLVLVLAIFWRWYRLSYKKPYKIDKNVV